MSNEKEQSYKKTLFNCEIGKPYKIVRCSLDEQTKNRLFEMGLVPHTHVVVTKRAPLGDPLQIFLRGYCLCVRGNVAKHFDVEAED